jgi:5-methylcytosine-specific restriction endonuclease McrA
MKVCSTCKKSKEFDDFHNDKTQPDGKRHECKECKSKYDIGYGKVRDKKSAEKRKEIEKELNENFTGAQVQEQLELFGHKCFNCGTIKELSTDHLYPINMGYPLTEENCIILCKSCNSSKGDRDPEVFFTPKQFDSLVRDYKKSKPKQHPGYSEYSRKFNLGYLGCRGETDLNDELLIDFVKKYC